MFSINHLEGQQQDWGSLVPNVKQKRDEYNIEIRKQKRDESLRKLRISNLDIEKKRQVGGFSTLGGSFDTPENIELRKCINEWLKRQFKEEEFLELVEAINSNNRLKQHYGTIGLRKILSQESGSPIQHAIDMNLVPRLIEFTGRKEDPHLQLEAAWILTNIASGNTEQTQVVIDNDGISAFLELLTSSKHEIVEQGIWALGNIAGDCHQFRKRVLEANAIDAFIILINSTNKSNIIKHGIWALSNLCRGRPLPKFESVQAAIPIFTKAIQQTADPDILTDACWALYHLSDADNFRIREFLETGIIPTFGKYLETARLSTMVPIIKIIGNILAGGNEEDINVVLQVPTIVPNLMKLLDHEKKVARKEACWAISNITAGNDVHIGTIIANNGYLNKVITLLISDPFKEVRREAAWILTNAVIRCNMDQLIYMFQSRVFDCFIDQLNGDDPKTLEIILDAINNIMKKGNTIAKQKKCENPFYIELEQKGGLEKIEHLQKHKSHEVYEAALRLLEKHYELEDETF